MRARVEIKPLSVNDAWKGRRYKTDKYKGFEKHFLLLLPNINVRFKGKISLKMVLGFSSAGSDLDNPIKPILDCLQKKYKFNDNKIYSLQIIKELVPVGNEFIELEIKELKN